MEIKIKKGAILYDRQLRKDFLAEEDMTITDSIVQHEGHVRFYYNDNPLALEYSRNKGLYEKIVDKEKSDRMKKNLESQKRK